MEHIDFGLEIENDPYYKEHRIKEAARRFIHINDPQYDIISEGKIEDACEFMYKFYYSITPRI